ncbi:MAG TPA: immunoglobulin domain-containing protein, partial [Verrucomicrobiae bacterium]
HTPHAQFTSHENIFVDADDDPSTGYSLFVGSEMLIQGGAGYQEANGVFNAGTINGLNWAAAPTGTADDFEVRISRHATNASDGSPVFSSDTIAFILEAEDANYARKDTAPDFEGIEYTFTPAPSPLGDAVDLVTMGSSTWRFLTPSSDPASDWKDPGFDDSAWSSGQGAFGYGAPIPIKTTLPTGQPVAYFRTRFDWTNDAAGVVLAASTQLGDGGVFYLNGQEVRRIRMPAGAINFNTAATNGAAAASPEIFGIPSGALVNGENVLAVEVHDRIQNNADFWFDLGLRATTNYPVIITDATQPVDRSIVAGQSTTFTAEVLGSGPISYQWLKDNQPIQNATNATFTITSALSGAAGAYSVRVTNPGTTVTSRAAQLIVTGTPVVITDSTLPADVTTTEGLPVSFQVQASGSAPVTYQWFKGVNSIDGATADTYTIDNVTPLDAGDYSVHVTNPVNSVTSRTAHLTVNRDLTGPGIASIAGSPNKVIIQFTEPVDATTANTASNYQITGGPTVQGAALDPNDATRVILTTTAQTLGAQYTLNISGVRDRFNNVIAAGPQVFTSSIVIDGSFDDWTGLQIAATDDQESPAAGTDFKDIWVSSDANYIYIRFTLYAPGDPNTYLNNIFIDADNDSSTGYSVAGIGSEMLIQSGAGYQEKNGGFNEGGINDLDFAIAPEGIGTDFELRISRNAKYENDGQRVFIGDTIRFVLETENASFATTDLAPNSGGLEVVLAQGPLNPVRATLQNNNIVLSWDGPGQLQTRASLTSGDWVDLTGETSPYTVPSPGAQAFFRLRSTTP